MGDFTKAQKLYDESLALVQAKVDGVYAIEALQSSHQSFRLSPSRKVQQETKMAELRTVPLDVFSNVLLEYGKLLELVKGLDGIPSPALVVDEQLEMAAQAIYLKSDYDKLTGVFNQDYLIANLESLLAVTRPEGSTLSLIVADIDGLGAYNTTHGKDAGDDLIRRMAETLKSCLFHGKDFVARLEGGRFAIALPDTKKNNARTIGERILKGIAVQNVPATLSMGIVMGTKGKTRWSVESFLSCAEEALHMAKSQGQNKFVYQGLKL